MKKPLFLALVALPIACCSGGNQKAGPQPLAPGATASVGAPAPVGSGGGSALPSANNPAGISDPNTMLPINGAGAAGPASQPSTGAAGTGPVLSAAAGAGGAVSANPVTADPPGTITLKMDPFMLQANQEIYKCQNFDNPFGGKETAVQRLVTDMSPGSHHLHVYHQTTGAGRALEDCTIADFHPLMFASSKPHMETQYQPGMAVKVLANSGVRIQVHYLNTKNEALMVSATLKLTPVDASTVTKWVSELYFTRAALQVPPGTPSITTTCSVPKTYGQIGIIGSGAHMHSRGTHFIAKTSTGVTLIETDNWEASGVNNDPVVMLSPGDTITWTCTYNNDTGGTLVFGESAQKNEMCIYLARFYSAPDQAQLECQAQADTGNLTMVRSY